VQYRENTCKKVRDKNMTKRRYPTALVMTVLCFLSGAACAEPLKILTAGAFKQVLLAVLPQFEKNGQQVHIDTDTVGGLIKRIQGGEDFDLVIASPAALETLGKSGQVTDKVFNLARVGVGVAVKDGATKPDISTVEGFKRALLAAKAVAYVDPASGGTSGIYIAGLVDKLGIGPEVKAKSVLVRGGFSAERVVNGEADLAIQQISELIPVKGVVLVGPLPAEIQNYTTYSAGISAKTKEAATAQTLVDLLRSQQNGELISSKGMEPAR
jgi:molybdate transport system substrate-binding protein